MGIGCHSPLRFGQFLRGGDTPNSDATTGRPAGAAQWSLSLTGPYPNRGRTITIPGSFDDLAAACHSATAETDLNHASAAIAAGPAR